MPVHVSSTCAHHQEVKIALHSLWYHHTYRCDDTRGCVMQFWPSYDEHMCSKHVEAWNKLIVKQKSSWLITEINWYASCKYRTGDIQQLSLTRKLRLASTDYLDNYLLSWMSWNWNSNNKQLFKTTNKYIYSGLFTMCLHIIRVCYTFRPYCLLALSHL